MTADFLADHPAPAAALEDLMARHGVLRVLMALPRALILQRRATLLLERPVSYHIARDIGLSYDPPPKTHWEYR